MQKRKPGPRAENDVRSQKSHYTNVSKLGSVPSKNLELSLEVELDEEVRNIIRNPEGCPSALLDVTVIKPKGLDQYTTNTQTLKTEQVKKLIGSMKLDSHDKKVLMDKLFGVSIGGPKQNRPDKNQTLPPDNKRKSCLSAKCKHVYRQSSINLGNQGDVQSFTDDSNTAIYSTYSQVPQRKKQPMPVPEPQVRKPPPAMPSKIQHIYTTPRTYENVRAMFACQNKEEPEQETKMEQPCLCQNCAIVGILTDSQKKPFATEPMPDPQEDKDMKYRKPSRKKSVSFKNLEELSAAGRSHEHCEAIFKLLSVRIGELERRVLLQEQKAVPKEYFKKIITKLVSHLSKLTHYTAEERSVQSSSHRDRDREFLAPHTKFKSNGKFYVSPVLVTNKIPAEKEYEPKPCSSGGPPRGASETLWRWGEEVLTSGRDLKNRVVVLLEDTLKNLKKNWEKSLETRKCDEEIQCIVDELSKNLKKRVRISRSRSRERNGSKTPVRIGCRTRTPDTSLASCESHKQELEKKTGKPSLIPKYKGTPVPVVNVAYVNPEMRRWPEESSVSFKIDESDYDSHKGSMSESKKQQYKRDFFKVLANTKKADKFKLWQNIWNQALENRQTKTDTVNIQIPDPKDKLRQKMIHLEYTIGELEDLLLRDCNCRSN